MAYIMILHQRIHPLRSFPYPNVQEGDLSHGREILEVIEVRLFLYGYALCRFSGAADVLAGALAVVLDRGL